MKNNSVKIFSWKAKNTQTGRVIIVCAPNRRFARATARCQFGMTYPYENKISISPLKNID